MKRKSIKQRVIERVRGALMAAYMLLDLIEVAIREDER